MSHKNPGNAIPSPPAHDYDRQTDFTQFSTNHPNMPIRGPDLDGEFNQIERAIDETQDRLDLIQRSDGALANHSVHPQAVAPATMDLLTDAAGAAGIEAAWHEAERARRYADEAGEIRDALPTTDTINSVAGARDQLTLLATDLAGTGWAYDLGSIAVEAPLMQSSPDGYMIAVYNHFDAIVTTAENIETILLVPEAAHNAHISASLSDSARVQSEAARDLSQASEVGAQTAQDRAEEWAEHPEDVPLSTTPNRFSAFHWAQKAAGFVMGAAPASMVSFDGTVSGLAADNVQEAIDEVVREPHPAPATMISYDNTISQLAAANVQSAIDELSLPVTVERLASILDLGGIA